jgi:two-component system chemotaxis response regulator CheB
MNPQIIVVGTSLGGLKALETLFGGLSYAFPTPIAVVQHRAKSSRDTLAEILQLHTALKVREVEDKDRLEPGTVYIAPADYHLLIEVGHCALSLDPPVSYARPSVDVLFESAADAYGAGVIGVVLTGNNTDGAKGCARIQEAGGTVIVQEPSECESPTMPNSAIAAVKVDHVLRLAKIAPRLIELCSPE